MQQADRFGALLRNLYFISRLRQRGEIACFTLGFNVTRHNFRDMKPFVSLGLDLGVDLVYFDLKRAIPGVLSPEIARNAMLEPLHPFHEEFMVMLGDSVFRDLRVRMGSLDERVNNSQRLPVKSGASIVRPVARTAYRRVLMATDRIELAVGPALRALWRPLPGLAASMGQGLERLRPLLYLVKEMATTGRKGPEKTEVQSAPAAHGPIVPFIILCAGRSGSNLLQTSLDQHPEIRAYGEVFNHFYSSRDVVNLLRRARDDEDGAAFVQHIFDPALGRRASAIGFKMMYPHVPDGPLSTAWTELSKMRDLVVVDLDRENLLECLVSTRKAEYTWAWRSTKQARSEVPRQIYLSPGDCSAFFEERLRLREQALARFKRHEIIRLTYDELRSDFAGSIARICEVLGVAPFEPEQQIF